ncbi:MAG: AraC family transcriptional regulator [Flavobacteriales bacterium]
MSSTVYPTFGICNLSASRSGNDLLNADPLGSYISGNPHLQAMHSHSFYHLVYFRSGAGTHTVDFETFTVEPGMIYFMKPGQVHVWNFEGVPEGYIVNFSPVFFDQLFISGGFIDRFPFFIPNTGRQVLLLPQERRAHTEALLEAVLQEQQRQEPSSQLMIAALLIQLFLQVDRYSEQKYRHEAAGYQSAVLRKFEQLIEEHFRSKRLPREYAELLHITPSHLNALCRELLGTSAGELIRNRVVLEAKRLLVNFERSVSAVAQELNFPDTSYFIRFFKKYNGLTPEQFRRSFRPQQHTHSHEEQDH